VCGERWGSMMGVVRHSAHVREREGERERGGELMGGDGQIDRWVLPGKFKSIQTNSISIQT
jgi:hypothetical protein